MIEQWYDRIWRFLTFFSALLWLFTILQPSRITLKGPGGWYNHNNNIYKLYMIYSVLGISIICLQVTRSWNNIGIECERVHEDVRMDIIEKIDKDEKFCLEEYQADIRTDSWFFSDKPSPDISLILDALTWAKVLSSKGCLFNVGSTSKLSFPFWAHLSVSTVFSQLDWSLRRFLDAMLILLVESNINLGMFDRSKMMNVVQSSNFAMNTLTLFSALILFSAHHSNHILEFHFSYLYMFT